MPRHRRRLPAAAARRLARPAGGAGAIVVVLAVALLAGCGPERVQADPAPVGTATRSAMAAPSPTPTPTAGLYDAPADAYVKPARPAILDGKPSEAAAIAFAKYYLRMYTYAYLTGDAGDLNALGESGCMYCRDTARDIAREYGAGGHDEGGAIHLGRVSAHGYGHDGLYAVNVDAEQAPVREVAADGSVRGDARKPHRFHLLLDLRRSGARSWTVVEVGVSDE